MGITKNVQVLMACGLIGAWKQPIYYDFDKPMKKKILKEIITEVENADFHVVAVVCNKGGINQGLWKELAVSHD